MSFAIRNDKQGQRAVNSPDDVGPDEYFSETLIQIEMVPSAAMVDEERERRLDAGIEFGGRLFQSRAADRENITGAAQLAFIAIVGGAKSGDLRWSDPDQDFIWIAADNSLVPMDAHTVVEFGKVAAGRKQALIYAARALKDKAVIPGDYADDKWWP